MWYADKLIQRALQELEPRGQVAPEPRLLLFPMGQYGHTNTLARQSCRNWFMATPMYPTPAEVMATGATFETSQIVDMFAQYSAHASSMSFAGYEYLGRFDVVDKVPTQTPPSIYFYRNSGVSLATANCNIVMVTKDGWLISGVSYPSACAMVRVTA